IAKETNAKVVGVDISDDALAIATQNVEANGVGELVELKKSNMFENVDGKYDIIISNPPYIPSKDIETLDVEVKNFEPHIALDGGVDGLEFYKIIAQQSPKFLKENGSVVLECGITQAQAIVHLFEEQFDCSIKKDLQGVDRIFIGTLK
ncbi:MAG: HemK/PrmC family methyltransferase, partial [Clostridia bacterium]